VPDDRFGEAVTAVVEPQADASVDEDDVIKHVREHIAAYKAPRHVVVVKTIGRSPAGKVDYAGLRRHAIEELGVDARM
jgi:acyl-CoA synthetase (AMP-forming)/AMP-acid ligase II